jgi:hypothetical protein
MDTDPKRTELLLDVYRDEYGKLKEEQVMRIKFRDGMIPLALAAFGALVSFALTKDEHHPALLLVPMICVILGWLYIANDEKVSHLGKYFRHTLGPRINDLLGPAGDARVLGWEVEHRDDDRRAERKFVQLVVDHLTFVLPGLLAVGVYLYLVWNSAGVRALISLFLVLPPLWLAAKINTYSDRGKGK